MDALWIKNFKDIVTDADETRFAKFLKEIADGASGEGIPTYGDNNEELSEICAIFSAIEAEYGLAFDIRCMFIDFISPHIDLMKFLSLVATAEGLESDNYGDISSELCESFKRGYSEETEKEIQASCDEKFIAWIYYGLDTVDNRYNASLIKRIFNIMYSSYELIFAYLALSIVKDEG